MTRLYIAVYYIVKRNEKPHPGKNNLTSAHYRIKLKEYSDEYMSLVSWWPYMAPSEGELKKEEVLSAESARMV